MRKIFKFIITLLITFICSVVFGILYEKYKLKEFTDLIASDPYYVIDSLSGHTHTPNFPVKYEWKEHPAGFIQKYTNNLGFVERDSTFPTKPDSSIRILVTGDSHIDGVVNNEESFPNLLELNLNSAYKNKKAEVLNAAAGFYSFNNYAGILKKFQYLKPDLFIVTIYTGNDFIEGLLYDPENQNFVPALQTFWYRLVKLKFQLQTKMASTQSTNQVLFFKTFPKKKEQALNLAKKYFSEIKKMCVANSTQLLVVFLPTKLEADKKFRDDVKNKSGWTDEDLNINKTMTDSLISWLNAQSILQLNVTKSIANKDQKLFWDMDQHLNIEGHKILADEVFTKLDWKVFNAGKITLTSFK